MTMSAEATTTSGSAKKPNTTAAIWAAVAVFLTVLAASAASFGLAGLVMVMVPAALGMVVILVRIVTEGM